MKIDDNAKMTTRMRDYIREQALLKPFSHTIEFLGENNHGEEN